MIADRDIRCPLTAQAGASGISEFWTLVNRAAHGRYDRYQHRTDRPLELVKLRPR